MQVLRGVFPLLIFVQIFAADASAGPGPLRVPWKDERLVFALSWFKIKAGTSVLEILEGESANGRKEYRISAVTTSNKYVDTIYKVRDRIESFTYSDNLASYRYKVHQEEGSFRRDKEIIFDYEKGLATYTRDRESSTHKIPSFVSDALSSLFYLRTRELTVGKSVTIDVFDNRKLWQVEVQVLRKERIETPAGVFNTIMIKPVLKFEGIFQRKGDVYIWLTDDERKMPVRMRSKIKIGSVSADLVEYKK